MTQNIKNNNNKNNNYNINNSKNNNNEATLCNVVFGRFPS